MTKVYLVISYLMRYDDIVLGTYIDKELADAHLADLEKTFVHPEIRDGDSFYVTSYWTKDPSVLHLSDAYTKGEHGWGERGADS